MSDGGAGKTTEEMKQQAIYTGWDFENTWSIDALKNEGYPYLAVLNITMHEVPRKQLKDKKEIK